jgi:DNA polymerase III subunit alpha
MAHDQFIHLAVRTAYSLSEGAIHIDALARNHAAAKIPAVAMSDSNNLFGALEFSETMRQKGIQPIIGVTLSVENPGLEESRSGRKPAPDKLRLYAQNDEGYRNLLKLVSRAYVDGDSAEEPQTAFDALAKHAGGVICLTAGHTGPVGRLLLENRAGEAEKLLLQLKEIYADRLYMEIMRHDSEAELKSEEAFLDMAFQHDIPIVATNDAHFIGEDMYRAHDALLCIADGTYVAEGDRRRLTPEHRLKSPEEMIALFADLPEAIENTVNIARRCAWKVEIIEPILPNFADGHDTSEADLLAEEARKGLKVRLDDQVLQAGDDRAAMAKPYEDRLEFELGVITQMGFPGYFLIVADFIHWAKQHDIPVGPGRGSGAGSVVAWALGITDLDPLRWGLLFERFLNPERVSIPDFDIDFCQDKRDQVIRYVQEKYGYEHVAQIITFGKLQARAVIRDVGRVLQQNYNQTDRLSKMIPNNPAKPLTLSEAIAQEPRLQYERDNDELTAAVIDRALKLEGLYRHASTHAAGVVIGDRPLDELVPLYRDPKSDMPVTQFNMKWVEKAGLVKFDFLGLKTLTVLAKTVEFINKSNGIEIDLEALPLDDKSTFDMLSAGNSAGVFQLESSGMRSVLKGLQPDKFEDIIALVALYRPGPMENIPTYVDRKHGKEEPDYLHPMLEAVLEETYGVIIYQEQVMQIAQILAGYSLGEADLLRRAMGKKIQKEMDAQRSRFVGGAVANGVGEGRANSIFNLVDKFAGYGFNKSHAAAYALIAYQTAYLKANHPVEFMAATMCLDQTNTDKLAGFKKELHFLKIPLLQPDINKSDVNFMVERQPNGDFAVRYALAAIKNVGDKAMAVLAEERQKNGPFKDLFDFAERIDARQMNKRLLENLIMAGAFDSINSSRAQAKAAVEMLLKHAHSVTNDKESAQENLFGGPGEGADRPPLPDVEPWEPPEELANEKAAIGFYLSAHPLQMYTDELNAAGAVPSGVVLQGTEYVGRTIKMAGAIDSFKERRSKKGKPYAYLSLSDMESGFEVVVFSDVLDLARSVVDAGVPVIVTVGVEKREEDAEVRLMLAGIRPIDQPVGARDINICIDISPDANLEALRALLGENRGGRGRCSLSLITSDRSKEVFINVPGHYKLDAKLGRAFKAMNGVCNVREV